MRVEVYGEPRGGWGWMCLESLVGFCREINVYGFQNEDGRDSRGWRRFYGEGYWLERLSLSSK